MHSSYVDEFLTPVGILNAIWLPCLRPPKPEQVLSAPLTLGPCSSRMYPHIYTPRIIVLCRRARRKTRNQYCRSYQHPLPPHCKSRYLHTPFIFSSIHKNTAPLSIEHHSLPPSRVKHTALPTVKHSPATPSGVLEPRSSITSLLCGRCSSTYGSGTRHSAPDPPLFYTLPPVSSTRPLLSSCISSKEGPRARAPFSSQEAGQEAKPSVSYAAGQVFAHTRH